MPFQSSQQVTERLADAAALTDDEIASLIPWLGQIGTVGRERVQIEATQQSTREIRKFKAARSWLTG